MVKFDLHPQNPNKRDVKTIVDILKDGGIGVIPTDSVYALTCLKSNKDGIERIIKITGKAEKKLSCLSSAKTSRKLLTILYLMTITFLKQ